MPGARKRAVKAPIAKDIPITQFCKRVCRTHRPVTNVKVSRDERDILHENLDSHGLQVSRGVDPGGQGPMKIWGGGANIVLPPPPQ